MDTVTIALAKGRLGEKTMDILEGCGVNCASVRDAGRKLIFDNGEGYKFLLVKPSDVPTYVYHGVADIGVVGKDTLLEANRPLYEMLDLHIGGCALCIAGPEDCGEQRTDRILRIATKYPNIALNYFNSRGRSVEIIKLNGSVELGPVTRSFRCYIGYSGERKNSGGQWAQGIVYNLSGKRAPGGKSGELKD